MSRRGLVRWSVPRRMGCRLERGRRARRVTELMEEEVDEVVGAKGKHDPSALRFVMARVGAR